ncbi:hypothetical protein VTO42DRAFT_1533 [Malbranchea cinnamomea]
MKLSLFSLLSGALLAVAAPTSKVAARQQGQAITRWDPVYDNPSTPLTATACSDGENGLINKGFNTIGDLPKQNGDIVIVAGATFTVGGWNSPSCGNCYKLEYDGRQVYAIAVDHASEGFVIGKNGLDILTNGRAEEAGSVQVTYTPVDASQCGL